MKSLYEDHLKVVRKRMQERIKNGESREDLKRWLVTVGGWSEADAERIVK